MHFDIYTYIYLLPPHNLNQPVSGDCYASYIIKEFQTINIKVALLLQSNTLVNVYIPVV